MQLAGVFCLKPGEICILISWPLVPSSKISIVTFWILSQLLNFCFYTKFNCFFLHSVIFEEALGEFLLFLFIDLELNLTDRLDLKFLLLSSSNKEVFFSRCV